MRLKPVGIGIVIMKIVAATKQMQAKMRMIKRFGIFLKMPTIPKRNNTRE